MLSDRFYMTYARSRPDTIVPYAEENNIGLMTNAAHRWSDATERFLPLWEYGCPHIVDSGGYNVLSGWVRNAVDYTITGEIQREDVMRAIWSAPYSWHTERRSEHPFFPWTVEEYHGWLTENADEFEWAAVMDLACEEVFDPLISKRRRVDATIQNTVEHFDLGPGYDLLPVLQGRSVDDYVYFYERLVNLGIPVTDVGLGTVCRISSQKAVVETEREIRERCRKIENIHGFGVKINAFKLGAGFESADSQAWVYKPTNGAMVIDRGDHLEELPCEDSFLRTVESFKHYYNYAERIKSSGNGQYV